MSSGSKRQTDGQNAELNLEDVSDLAEFCLNWPRFKKEFEALSPDGPNKARRELYISWLVTLADRTLSVDED